jgi:plastocyanin
VKARVALVVLVLAAAGCSGSGGDKEEPKASGQTVELRLLQFTPAQLTVKAGTTVTWRDAEPITHTVTSGSVSGVDQSTGLRAGESPDGLFDERLGSQDASFTYTFTQPGTYSYFCSIHKGMNATVVVTA